MQSSIKKTWHVLQNDTQYGRLLTKLPRLIYRKGKSIGNHLVRSDIASRNKVVNLRKIRIRETRVHHNCQNCTAIIKGATVSSPMKGFWVSIKGCHACNGNVIYMLKCPCGKTYISQTSRNIRQKYKSD